MFQDEFQPPRHALDVGFLRQVYRRLTGLLNARITDENGSAIGQVKYAGGGWVFKFKSSSESTQVKLFVITELNHNDFFVGQEITGLVNDADTQETYGQFGSGLQAKIAKPMPQRRSIASEVIDGVTITYTDDDSQTANGAIDNSRIANDGVKDESQVCFPRYMEVTDDGGGIIPGNPLGNVVLMSAKSVVCAMKMPNGAGVYDFSGTTPERVDWLQISPAMVWARRFTQPS